MNTPSSDTTPPPCRQNIYVHGEPVFVTDTIGKQDMEAWVRELARRSGQPVDWHYLGGKSVVKAMGDIQRVKETLQDLMQWHDLLRNEALKRLFQ